jgi:AraC-like DNA-binding protein
MAESCQTRIEQGIIGESRWLMAERTPCAPIRPHVLNIHGYEERSPEPACQRQFPSPFIAVIIEFGAPLRVTMQADGHERDPHPGGFVAGLVDTWADTEHDGCQRGVQVDLTPTGARRLFGIPMSEISGRVVALQDLGAPGDGTLAERLAELPDWPSRLDLVEGILLRRLVASGLDSSRVDWALGQIETAGGVIDIASLARELGYSRKHLITLFRDQVGVPPKLLARLVRFDRVMRRARSGAPGRWAELAIDFGYCDQAHLAREVRGFTGLSPTQARAQQAEWVDLFG